MNLIIILKTLFYTVVFVSERKSSLNFQDQINFFRYYRSPGH